MNNSEECEIVGDAILKTSKPTKWKYWLVPARDANASPVVFDDDLRECAALTMD